MDVRPHSLPTHCDGEPLEISWRNIVSRNDDRPGEGWRSGNQIFQEVDQRIGPAFRQDTDQTFFIPDPSVNADRQRDETPQPAPVRLQ